MQRLRFMLAVALLCTIRCLAQSPNEAYLRESYVSSSGDTLNYRLLVPEEIKEGTKYPLVLFMHGAGERGDNNESQLIHGAKIWLNPVNRSEYPAFVVIPQCPEDGYWAYNERPETFNPAEMPILEEPTAIIVEVKELVDSLASLPEIDETRIYVYGLSMGGMATYDLAIRYPETFAAAIPICGTVNPDRLVDAKDVKFRIYHGDADTTVPVEGSREAYKKLKSLGADVIYTEFPGVGHGSWYPAFTDKEFLPWMFSQKK